MKFVTIAFVILLGGWALFFFICVLGCAYVGICDVIEKIKQFK